MKHKAVVTIKMGLSRITIGKHRPDGSLSDILVFKTPPQGSVRSFQETFGRFPDRWGAIDAAVVVNVVPDIDPSHFSSLSLSTAQMKILVPKSSEWPVAIDYTPPGSLGVDRVAACLGARWRFQTGERFIVVADFGTHTVLTFFRSGQVLGGALFPGICLQLSSVGAGRALSSFPLGRPYRVIGRNTLEGVLSGTVFGTVKAVEGLTEEMERLTGTGIDLILTGGLSRFVQPYFRRPVRANRQLVHFGAWAFLMDNPLKEM